MNRYGFLVLLAFFELLGIFAVDNPSALMEWIAPRIRPYQYPEMKLIVKFIGWGFISIPLLILVGFYFGRNP
jgi:hypothetical protein